MAPLLRNVKVSASRNQSSVIMETEHIAKQGSWKYTRSNVKDQEMLTLTCFFTNKYFARHILQGCDPLCKARCCDSDNISRL